MLLLISVKNWSYCKRTLQLESSVCFIMFQYLIFISQISGSFCVLWNDSPHNIILSPHYPKQRTRSTCDDNRFLRNETSGLTYRWELRYKGPAKIFSNSHPQAILLCPEKNVFQNPLLNFCGSQQIQSSSENSHCQNPLVRCCNNIIKSRISRKKGAWQYCSWNDAMPYNQRTFFS